MEDIHIKNNKIDYNSEKFKYAKDLCKEKNITIFDIDWNKFSTKEQIKKWIELMIEVNKELYEGDK